MAKNVRFQRFKNNALFLLLGFFVFSSFSSTIILKYLHLPISLPELLLVPFVFLLWDKLSSIKFQVGDMVITFGVLAVLLVIGMICGEFPLYSMVSTSRSWFYLLMCTFAFSRENKIDSEDLMWLSFGSVLAWFVESVLKYRRLISGILFEGDEVITYGLMLAVPVLLATTIHKSRYVIFSLSIVIISLTVVFAGLRRLLAVALLSILVGVILKVLKHLKQFVPFFIIGLFITVLANYSVPIIGEFVRDNSPVMYYRVFERTGNFLESGDSGSAGDQSRLNHFERFFDDVVDHTIPYGMVSTNTRDNWAGYFNDFPLYQLCWIFSWPITLFFLIKGMKLFFQNLRKYRSQNDVVSFVSLNCITIMFMLLFLEGTYVAFPFATPITGLLLGRSWLNVNNKHLYSIS